MSICRQLCPDGGYDAQTWWRFWIVPIAAAERTAAAAPLGAKALAVFFAKLIEGPMPAGRRDPINNGSPSRREPDSLLRRGRGLPMPHAPRNPKMGPDRTAALSSSEATTRSPQVELTKAGVLPESPRSRSLPYRLK